MVGLWGNGRGALYVQLADAIEHLIESGVIRAGEVLPPERSLAAALDVSRGTVVSAYGRLADSGLVERAQGSGTRVSTAPLADVDTAQPIGDPLFATAPRAVDLLVAVPKVMPRVLEIAQGVDLGADASLLDESEPAGILPLRRRIAERITAEGLATTHHQVLVTAGAQQAMLLCCMALIKPGDVALCEETTWPGLVDGVARFGGRTHGVSMDENGIIVDELRSAIERLRPAFIALNPHHHNPTGTRLSPDRRRQVAELASAYAVPLIEDRVVTRLAFDGQIPAPLAAGAEASGNAALHIVVDSINKVAWPGFRLGWVRADGQMVTRLRSMRALTDLYSPIHSQLAAIPILDELDAVVADRVDELTGRCDRLMAALTEALPDWRVPRPRGGLVLWVELPEGSASAFCEHAARFGVLVANGRQFGELCEDTHLRIPFTATPAELDEGVRRLAEAWRHFDRSQAGSFEAAALI